MLGISATTMSLWDRGGGCTGCVIAVVSPTVGEGSWIVSVAGTEGVVVEDICSIGGGPGEPWDFPLRLEETKDRKLRYIDIKG